jgi:hypothetical protein
MERALADIDADHGDATPISGHWSVPLVVNDATSAEHA